MTGGAAPRRKGSTFERDVVHFLQDHGLPDAERTYGAGRPEDVGDIDGVPGFTVEAKCCNALSLGPWCDEVERERARTGRPYAAVVAKRRGKTTESSYVVMTLETFARLLAEL